MNDTSDKPYTVQEAALMLGVAPSTLYDRAKKNQDKALRPIRVGATTRYPRRVIDRLVAGEAA